MLPKCDSCEGYWLNVLDGLEGWREDRSSSDNDNLIEVNVLPKCDRFDGYWLNVLDGLGG